MSRRATVVVAVIAIIALVAGVLWWQGRDSEVADDGDQPLLITRQAERKTLRTEQTLRGVLERVEAKTVNAPGQGRASQVFISDGDLVEPGDSVLAIDGRPSVAVVGDLEFFRPLDVGSRGPDVTQLEQVLLDAGFNPGIVDDLYTNDTRSALALWQAVNGFPGSTPESGETITLALQGSGAYTVGAQNTAAITIDPLLTNQQSSAGPGAFAAALFAQALPVVSLVSTTPAVTEGGTATFLVSTDIAPTAPLTIGLVYAGTAQSGVDYTQVVNATIPAGSTSATISIATMQDSLVENTEAIDITAVAGAGYTLGTQVLASVAINDDEPRPQIQVLGNTTVAEGQTATITITASQASADPLTVSIQVNGTATAGGQADYEPLGTVFTVPAGATSVTVPVITLTDDLVEDDETILIRVLERPGYTIGSSDTATVTITDTTVVATPIITVTADDDTVAEGGAITFTIDATDAAGDPLDINFTLGGTAIGDVDYERPDDFFVTLGANATTATVTLTGIDDDLVRPDSVVNLSLLAGNGYIVGAPNFGQTIIEDNDVPELELTGTTSVIEGGQAALIITADQAPLQPLQVQLNTQGEAVPDLDYDRLPLSVDFPAGATTITVPVRTLTDSTIEFDELVIVDLGQAVNVGGQNLNLGAVNGDYTVGARQQAVVTIVEQRADQGPVLTISSSADSTPEGSTVIFTINASNPSDRPVDLRLALTGSAVLNRDYTFPTGLNTLQPGQTQLQLQAQTRQDDGIEGDKSITVTILPGTGYVVGDPATAHSHIVSEDIPELTLRGGNVTLAEGESVAFIIEADQAPTEDTSVNYTYATGSATPGVDFEVLTGTVVLQAGHKTVTVPVFTISDDVRFEPFDMMVAEWPARVGDITVDAGQSIVAGQPIVEITEDTFSVTLTTDANTRSDLNVGMTVELEIAAAGDLETLGELVEIDDTASVDGNGAEIYEGRIDLTEEVVAAEGANVTITVVTEEAANAIVVPIASVLQGPDGDEVRVINLDTGELERKVVVTGLDEDSFIEIKSGIDVGDLIVIEVEG